MSRPTAYLYRYHSERLQVLFHDPYGKSNKRSKCLSNNRPANL